MFLKRVRRIIEGLKFRAVAGFGILFIASAILCWFFTAELLDRAIRQDLDEQLSYELNWMESIYITGLEKPQTGKRIPIESISDSELSAVRDKFQSGRLLCVFEQKGRGKNFRFFYIDSKNKIFQVRLNADGSLYTRIRPKKKRLDVLQSAMKARIRSEGEQRLKLQFYDNKGKLVLSSSEEELPEIDKKRFFIRSEKLFDGSTLVAALSTHTLSTMLNELWELQGGVFLAFCAIIIPGGGLLLQRLLSGVTRVSSAAQRIAKSGDFDCHVENRGGATEINDLVNAFNSMNDNNLRLFKEVRNVTDDIAHELKTPLTRLRGAAEVAMTESPELAGVVSEECSEMLSIINSMLEITRTESGLIAPNRENVDLSSILENAHELFLPIADDKNIEFSLDQPEDRVFVCADRIKIQRVFANLIDNALKFTPQGGKIKVSLVVKDDHVAVTVADNGCGISEDNLPHIFDRLFRCDTSRSHPGSGLGLSLAAAIIKSHGGRIDVISSLGNGSDFTVVIPRSGEDS